GEHTLLVLEPPADALPPSLPRDAVFVVDISGSMAGPKMEAAKLALKTALHGLLPQDRFLIIAFDNRVEMLEDQFLPVDDGCLARADRWVDQLHARGGTVMAPALERALTVERTPKGRQRTVLFVTDGQSTDEERLMQLLWQRRGAARVFPLGIDTAVNSALLRRMARIGGGVCELTEPTADIEAVVARLEARFGTPLVEGITIAGATPARSPLPALFLGRPATILLEGGPPTVAVTGTSSSGSWSVAVAVQPAPFPLGSAWARARVASLEDRLIVKPFEEDALRPEILRVALEYGVASRCTAFVAVDSSAMLDGRPVEVVQPMEAPAHSAPSGLPFPALAAAAAPAFFARSSAMPVAMMVGAPPPRSAPLMQAEDRSPAVDAPEAPSEASGLLGALRKAIAPKKAARDRETHGAIRPDRSPVLVQEQAPVASSADAPASDAPGAIARRQSADGSFGEDLVETIVSMLILVRAGHTRRRGVRRRVVAKAADWLSGQPHDSRIDAALDVLAQMERGGSVSADGWQGMAARLGDAGQRL
ncbi:MAG: hypothetical protein CL927_02105, partial [Deltaproteobacteria bacterium]|nr:hypothetical protein [Deltaproteobacteria bacterium]HCH66313.1 hypothetical protein [Deltaproteobacteria bacterium]